MKDLLGFNNLSLEEFLKKQNPEPIRQIIAAIIADIIHEKYETPRMEFTTDELLSFWPEHEALHFLTGLDNSFESERKIAWYENQYNVGFNIRNGFMEEYLQDDLPVKIDSFYLLEVAHVIRNYYKTNIKNHDSIFTLKIPGKFSLDLLYQSGKCLPTT